ncbi:PHP domain-containing protein [Crossiella sp. SN42]|uniref:PHP domain-containing protein n=1 Tax=Crossiella sp. SN42 TaxID=2944808 RepID=UPI00207C9F17|nr:PHP domain-containing protein [Crossiella sp. SN42]MCO1574272.1 PHP domain-containing protein [Crossiella sp. SN42]
MPDEALPPDGLSRRAMLRRAGLLGAGLAVAPGIFAATANAAPPPRGGYRWLAGDHHIHTQYSLDGRYRVIDHVRQGAAHGLDWMVITDHGGPTHARIGVERVNPEIVAARRDVPEALVFQGLEWNVPAAEHGTVFVHPGREEVRVLKEFEGSFDGIVRNALSNTPANEALAIAGIDFLAEALRRRRIEDVLFLANHPARQGIDTPHEIRNWRDAQPHIAVGMEAAPGHQAAGIAKPHGAGLSRGYYFMEPGPDSFPAYPPASYRTFGGFDWMTATVGGLWDSLLAEGRPWWVTANSDSHAVYGDTAVTGPGSNFDRDGKLADAVHGPVPDLTNADFWPGAYTRTHVGADGHSYRAVMAGIRAGRVWVDHGALVAGLDIRLRTADRWAQDSVTLGGVLRAKRGTALELVIDVDLARLPNWAQFVPKLARVDLIQGAVTGPVADRDTFSAPKTKVVRSFTVSASAGTVRFTHALGRLESPFYLRLRGTDGKRVAVGLGGAAVDPAGPAMDVAGDADPWEDLWFYTNPMWALPG